VIWSIIPEDVIFASQQQPDYRQITYLGRQVTVIADDQGGGEIVALVSSNPADYLDQRFALGSKIKIN